MKFTSLSVAEECRLRYPAYATQPTRLPIQVAAVTQPDWAEGHFQSRRDTFKVTSRNASSKAFGAQDDRGRVRRFRMTKCYERLIQLAAALRCER